MASLTGETIVFTTDPGPSDLSITLRLQQGLTKKEEEDEKVLENLKRVLKEKQREAYIVQRDLREKMCEWHKIQFMRVMEKAWLTNAIIKERCLISHETKTIDQIGRTQLSKALDFDSKIKCAMSLGLDGILFGPSNKRKRFSSDDKEAEEEEEEELQHLKKRNEEILLQIVPRDIEKVRKYCEKTYMRDRPFAKLESREECLECIINSLLEREAREIVIRPTENELLGYILLKEIINTTLLFPHLDFPPNTILGTPNSEKEPRDEKILVGIESALFTGHAVDGSDLETLVASNYNAMLKEAKSVANKSEEMQLIKEMIAVVEQVISQRKSGILQTRISQVAAERSFETKLVKHCEQLVDMRLARCLNEISPTETDRLGKIISLADKAIEKHTLAKGPHSLPQITEPVCPSYPPPLSAS